MLIYCEKTPERLCVWNLDEDQRTHVQMERNKKEKMVLNQRQSTTDSKKCQRIQETITFNKSTGKKESNKDKIILLK
jgi:hypothetical protein